MTLHPLAGKPMPHNGLVNIPALIAAYYTESPDMENPGERVAFGTSGHRGSPLKRTFTEAHILAITQAVCLFRAQKGIDGPLFLGMDTHALSEAAFRTALEVLAANNVTCLVAPGGGFTPTPVVSHAILRWNAEHADHPADGILITPSHNPPDDGGLKYNPPHGGPAESTVTKAIEQLANDLLQHANRAVRRIPLRRARASGLVRDYDFVERYVGDLEDVLDMKAIAASGIRLGVDPLGGASIACWEPIAARYGLNLTVTSETLDPDFRFIPCDKDGKIRMDCSSPFPMSRLLAMKDSFDLAFGCDPDADRHGIVTADGLMNPNHYLSAIIDYLFQHRPQWPRQAGIGKTLVTSALVDRVGTALGRRVIEVPVGFKWFVPYLHDGSCCLGCEESAGASFLCKDARPWSTDKDGPLLCLAAAELMAKEGQSPSRHYQALTERYGQPFYERLDIPANPRLRTILGALHPEHISLTHLGGEPIRHILTHAPGNDAPIGGLKIITDNGWIAIRPSGTEDICKIYTESFTDQRQLKLFQEDASALLETLLH